MNIHWLVTPYFFEQFDPALSQAVPQGSTFQLNNPGRVTDRSPLTLRRLHLPIAQFVEATAIRGDLPISIAGDCIASLPVMAGLQAVGLNPILVWLDGHGDFNIPETSPSGFLGGMPLAMMVGRGNHQIGENVGLSVIPEQDVWLIGARDIDAPEMKNLNNSQIHRLDVENLRQLKFDRPVHLHIDNDVIDSNDVPANNYPVPNGPNLEMFIDACSHYISQNNVCAVSLSGWNSVLDLDGRTSDACKKLMHAIRESCIVSIN